MVLSAWPVAEYPLKRTPMARTFGLIGTRPDVGSALVDAQFASLEAQARPEASWGIGFFEQDEVLLRKGRGSTVGVRLSAARTPVRTHGVLAHECDGSRGPQRTEATPPLRYGHLVFTCQGVADEVKPLVQLAKLSLPEFLQPALRGETFSELAFALFLSALPSAALNKTRMREPKRSADPLKPDALTDALRTALFRLDELAHATQRPAFRGDLWVHTGEVLMIAHREGDLGLQVLRGAKDLERLGVRPGDGMTGLEQASFVMALASEASMNPAWERLPHAVLVTAERGLLPRTESL